MLSRCSEMRSARPDSAFLLKQWICSISATACPFVLLVRGACDHHCGASCGQVRAYNNWHSASTALEAGNAGSGQKAHTVNKILTCNGPKCLLVKRTDFRHQRFPIQYAAHRREELRVKLTDINRLPSASCLELFKKRVDVAFWTCFNIHGALRLTVGLSDLRGLLQVKQFYNSMKRWQFGPITSQSTSKQDQLRASAHKGSTAHM